MSRKAIPESIQRQIRANDSAGLEYSNMVANTVKQVFRDNKVKLPKITIKSIRCKQAITAFYDVRLEGMNTVFEVYGEAARDGKFEIYLCSHYVDRSVEGSCCIEIKNLSDSQLQDRVTKLVSKLAEAVKLKGK